MFKMEAIHRLRLERRRMIQMITINQSINKLYLPSNLQCSTEVLMIFEPTTLINNYDKKLILYNK